MRILPVTEDQFDLIIKALLCFSNHESLSEEDIGILGELINTYTEDF